jgi:hypothetical protein
LQFGFTRSLSQELAMVVWCEVIAQQADRGQVHVCVALNASTRHPIDVNAVGAGLRLKMRQGNST